MLQEEITHCAAGVRWLTWLHEKALREGLPGGTSSSFSSSSSSRFSAVIPTPFLLLSSPPSSSLHSLPFSFSVAFPSFLPSFLHAALPSASLLPLLCHFWYCKFRLFIKRRKESDVNEHRADEGNCKIHRHLCRYGKALGHSAAKRGKGLEGWYLGRIGMSDVEEPVLRVPTSHS